MGECTEDISLASGFWQRLKILNHLYHSSGLPFMVMKVRRTGRCTQDCFQYLLVFYRRRLVARRRFDSSSTPLIVFNGSSIGQTRRWYHFIVLPEAYRLPVKHLSDSWFSMLSSFF
jgi:hypothetical protein